MSKALIIVDPQIDFCQGGSLEVKDSNKIFEAINKLKKSMMFDYIFVTLDWHPSNHYSFASSHDREPFSEITIERTVFQLWPVHCVENTEGAQISPLL
jgi:nicotinamidase/pyrazinamidase